MPDRKPWHSPDTSFAPYPVRRPPALHAADRAVLRLAAPWVVRLTSGCMGLRGRVALVRGAASGLETLRPDGLRHAAEVLRPLLAREGFAPPLVARAFALVGEATHRALGFRHHAVQIMGGWALLEGRLAEMATGEGKTVTATLAAATAALAGMPVHVVTVNDYLARRDALELASVYRQLGLDCAHVEQGDDEAARRAAYAADITYVTSKEVGFDFLRDRLAARRWRHGRHARLGRLLDDSAPIPRLRGLGFAVVDEADSVLIDESRTPLIIAERTGGAENHFAAVLEVARSLQRGTHFRLHPDRRSAELTEIGGLALAAEAGRDGLWRFRRAREDSVRQALAALHLYRCGHEYIVRDNGVHIVDEYTGRVAEGRHWEHGLHQLIEAKEGVEGTPRDRTAERITYQSFFRRYARLSGMSGTVREHGAEFWAVFGLGVRRIPPHRPPRRRCTGRRLYATADDRWRAVAEAAARMASEGRPVLIGTRSVAASEAVAAHLAQRGLRHSVLSASQDREEAATVARAGEADADGLGRITVATNMAGRGTDIRLGPGIAARGGLHVILTEYHESPRIDRQLIGRGARQGDPGSWQAIVALDDALFTLHAPRLLRAIVNPLIRYDIASDMLLSFLRRSAQARAGRMHEQDRRAAVASERAVVRQLAFAVPE